MIKDIKLINPIPREYYLEYIEENQNVLNITTDCKDIIEVIVSQIYDDFESRVCKNCEYYDSKYNICDALNLVLPEEFGCNKFQRVEDKD